jgi:hypothetical protein
MAEATSAHSKDVDAAELASTGYNGWRPPPHFTRKRLMNPDYRLLEHPVADRKPSHFADDLDDSEYEKYVAWLSKYLKTVNLRPAIQQGDLFTELGEISPERAIRRLASDLGLQHASRDLPGDDESGAEELEEQSDWNHCEWPHKVEMPIDVGYRVLLARILRPLASEAKRVKLLKQFFSVYTEYALK